MKITKERLKQIIKEELGTLTAEATRADDTAEYMQTSERGQRFGQVQDMVQSIFRRESMEEDIEDFVNALATMHPDPSSQIHAALMSRVGSIEEMVDPRVPRYLQKKKAPPATVDRTSAAGRHLVDAGILRDSDMGDPLEKGMTTQDARQSLEAAGFDEAEIRDALRPLHLYYRE